MLTIAIVALGAVLYLGAGIGIASAVQEATENTGGCLLLAVWLAWPLVIVASVLRGLLTTRRK